MKYDCFLLNLNICNGIHVEIEEMNRLYVLLGTYAEVGRAMKRSGSTVARYIDKRITSKYEIDTIVTVDKR